MAFRRGNKVRLLAFLFISYVAAIFAGMAMFDLLRGRNVSDVGVAMYENAEVAGVLGFALSQLVAVAGAWASMRITGEQGGLFWAAAVCMVLFTGLCFWQVVAFA